MLFPRYKTFKDGWYAYINAESTLTLLLMYNIILGWEEGGRGKLYILLNEISQLVKRSARFLPADLCTDHAHYVKNHR